MADEKRSAKRELKVVDESDVAEYYSNSVGFAMGYYDVALLFGLQKPSTQGVPIREMRAIINMSPQHAKVVCLLLKKNLEEYQKKYGEIVVPDELCSELGIEGKL